MLTEKIKELGISIISSIPIENTEERRIAILTLISCACSIANIQGLPHEEFKELSNRIIDSLEENWFVG